MADLPNRYDPTAVEPRWYAHWETQGFFRADAEGKGKPYCIVIPPPNVTGSLHMGHALDNTLQDILIRMKRMDGFNTLWMPGTDHAGIATQYVVERQLAAEGKTKEDLGRDAFVARVWGWKQQAGGTIIRQLKRLGASCDWSRERFTMDEGMSRAVREVFVRLWEEGLIVRDDYIVNWCPRCQTVLSDLEVEREDRDGEFVYIKYGPLTLGTVRPETKLGDTGLAVHPRDARYAQYVGRELEIASVDGPITVRVVADEAVDPTFGTGVIKVTPGHDPVDFEIGRRHNLPIRTVIGFDGKMTEQAGRYAGLDRFECRRRIVEDMQALGLIERIEPYRHTVGVCYRCKTVVEPLVSQQWFVQVKPLAEPALKAVRDGRIRIVPRGVGEDVRPLDGEHSQLADLAPALVGSSHPRVVLRRRRVDARVADGSRRLSALRRPRAPGHRRPRHVVLLGVVAVLDLGMAGPDRRAAEVLSHLGPRHRLRHPVLLGRADGHVWSAHDGRGALPRCLHSHPGSRCRGPKDVQDPGKRRRPPRVHGQVRDGCLPLHPGGAGRAGGARHPDRRGAGRGLPQLRQQALERRALRPRQPRGVLHPRRPARSSPLSPTAGS